MSTEGSSPGLFQGHVILLAPDTQPGETVPPCYPLPYSPIRIIADETQFSEFPTQEEVLISGPPVKRQKVLRGPSTGTSSSPQVKALSPAFRESGLEVVCTTVAPK